MTDTDTRYVILIAGHEMGIHGGGSTCAQIARAYTRARFHVIYVAPDSPYRYHPIGIHEVPLEGFRLTCWGDMMDDSSVLHIALPCEEALQLVPGWSGKKFYHCRDNWGQWVVDQGKIWDWWDPNVEEEIIESVDYSFAVSPRLAADVLGNDQVVHNGYDPTVFSWTDRDPDEVSNVVTWGFSGGFFDSAMFRKIARADQSITYTVIGRESGLSRRTTRLDNVNFVGPQPMTKLPEFAAEADAGIIVRESAGVPEYMDPIKGWEFLGSGLPFVSVGPSYPNNETNPACLHVSSDVQMIVERLKNVYSLLNMCEEDAKRNTWDRRVEQILEA